MLEYWALAKLKRGDIADLLRITNSILVPNLSGVALLYRLAGHYRNARAKEEAGDFSGAFRSYEMLMIEDARSHRTCNCLRKSIGLRRFGLFYRYGI